MYPDQHIGFINKMPPGFPEKNRNWSFSNLREICTAKLVDKR